MIFAGHSEQVKNKLFIWGFLVKRIIFWFKIYSFIYLYFAVQFVSIVFLGCLGFCFLVAETWFSMLGIAKKHA